MAVLDSEWEKSTARDDLPMKILIESKSVDKAPPPFQIKEDPHNSKRKLPTSAIALTNKTKETPKAQIADDSPNSPVVKVGRGKSNGRQWQKIISLAWLMIIYLLCIYYAVNNMKLLL